MMLLWMILWSVQPSEDWQVLINARMAKQSQWLDHSHWMAPQRSHAEKRAYLLTLGQIGNPKDADRIAEAFSDLSLQADALFAYGELEMAATDLLFKKASSVEQENLLLLLEAISKLGSETDHQRVVALWDSLDAKNKNQALFYLWRLKPEALTQKVVNHLKQTDRMDQGYVYYAYRSRTKMSADAVANILKNCLDQPQTAIYASRIRITKPTKALTNQYLSMAESKNWRLRVQAINGLAAIGAEETASKGLLMLSDNNPNVAKAAMTTLVRLNRKDIDRNITAFPKALTPALRQTAVATATKDQAKTYWPLVSDWATNYSTWQQRKWLELMPKASLPNAVTLLDSQFAQKNSFQMVMGLNALKQIDSNLAHKKAPEMFESSDPFILNAALGTFSDQNPEDWPVSFDKVTEKTAATYKVNNFHFSYIQGLKRWFSAEKAEQKLDQMAQHPDYLVRYNAVKAMGNPNAAAWEKVFASAWNPKIPKQVVNLAAEMLHTQKLWTLTLRMPQGDVVIKLEPQQAPITCANIVYLSSRSYFVGVPLHRVVPNFVVQMGDSRGDGSGGPGYEIPCEVNTLRYERGSVGMALLSKDSGGGQFFICHSSQPHLDGGYTIFGKVIKGMSVVDRLQEGDLIRRANINMEAGSEASLRSGRLN